MNLSEQLETLSQTIRPLINRNSDDPIGAYGQCKSAIAECEALLAMLKQEKSDIEYDILESNE